MHQIGRDLAFGIRLLAQGAGLCGGQRARRRARASARRPPSSASSTASCCGRCRIAEPDRLVALWSRLPNSPQRVEGESCRPSRVARRQQRVRRYRARQCAAEFQPDWSGRTRAPGRRRACRPISSRSFASARRSAGLHAGRRAGRQRPRRVAQRRLVEAAVRRRPVDCRTHDQLERKSVRGRGRHATRLPIPRARAPAVDPADDQSESPGQGDCAVTIISPSRGSSPAFASSRRSARSTHSRGGSKPNTRRPTVAFASKSCR